MRIITNGERLSYEDKRAKKKKNSAAFAFWAAKLKTFA